MSFLAEQAVIGSLLMDIGSIAKIYEELRPEMFTNQILQRAYFEIVKAYDIDENVNLITLCQKLQGCGFDDDTIFKEIRQCVETTITSVEIESYARTLINDYKVSQLSATINRIKPSPNEIDIQIGELINTLETLRNNSNKAKLKLLRQVVEEQAPQHFVDKPEVGIHIGFEQMDDMLVLLEPGDVMVIGARPAVGKSAFVTQIIGNLSEAGKRGALYNLEMSDKQVYERMLSSNTGIGLKRVRMAKAYLGDEKQKVNHANEKMSGYNLYLHSGTVKPSDIRNECRNLELDYIIIDYLQLMESDKPRMNRVNEVGDISKAVKRLASGLGVPVIILSQLNRASESRTTKEPELRDLRESGDIEQDASFVIFLWNLDEDEDESRKGAKIAKNRQGELGKVELHFDGPLMRFTEIGKDGSFVRAEKTPFDD